MEEVEQLKLQVKIMSNTIDTLEKTIELQGNKQTPKRQIPQYLKEIKETELRPGNLIQVYRSATDKNVSIYEIKSVYFDDDFKEWFVELSDGFCINIKTGIIPILLTEEWLIRLGFEKAVIKLDCTMWKRFTENGVLNILTHQYSINNTKPFIKLRLDNPHLNKVYSFVHELQNLCLILN